MHWSKWLVFFAALLVIGSAFLPWVHIISLDLIITGYNDGGLNYGDRGKFQIFLAVTCLLLYIAGREWSVLTAIVLSVLNLAFSASHFWIYRPDGGAPIQHLYGLYVNLAGCLALLAGLLFTPVPKAKTSVTPNR